MYVEAALNWLYPPPPPPPPAPTTYVEGSVVALFCLVVVFLYLRTQAVEEQRQHSAIAAAVREEHAFRAGKAQERARLRAATRRLLAGNPHLQGQLLLLATPAGAAAALLGPHGELAKEAEGEGSPSRELVTSGTTAPCSPLVNATGSSSLDATSPSAQAPVAMPPPSPPLGLTSSPLAHITRRLSIARTPRPSRESRESTPRPHPHEPHAADSLLLQSQASKPTAFMPHLTMERASGPAKRRPRSTKERRIHEEANEVMRPPWLPSKHSSGSLYA